MIQDPTKARLLEAAGEEFAEKGFEGATVRSICQRAGANQAAVNYHFGSKEQLYLQTVVEAHRCGPEPPAEAELSGLSPAEALRKYIHRFLAQILEGRDQRQSWHNILMIREMLRPTEACDALVSQSIRPRFDRLAGIIRRICPEADQRRLDAICFSVVGQCLHYKVGSAIAQRLIGDDRFADLDLDYLTDHIAGFTLAALGQAPPIQEAGMMTEPAVAGTREG